MQNKLRILFVGLICVSTLLFAADYTVSANIDNTITFQGYLTDAGGRPFFGKVELDFDFYKQETGGSVITSVVPGSPESVKLNREVQVFNGQYATKLAIPENILTLLNGESDIWVEVKIGNSERLTPRVQLTSAAQALQVRGIYFDNTAQAIKIGQGFRNRTVGDANIDLIVSGNVGIGTNNPSQARLMIEENGMNVSGNMYVRGNIVPVGGVDGAVWN